MKHKIATLIGAMLMASSAHAAPRQSVEQLVADYRAAFEEKDCNKITELFDFTGVSESIKTNLLETACNFTNKIKSIEIAELLPDSDGTMQGPEGRVFVFNLPRVNQMVVNYETVSGSSGARFFIGKKDAGYSIASWMEKK